MDNTCKTAGCAAPAEPRRSHCDRHETERLEKVGEGVIRRLLRRRHPCRCAEAGRGYCETHRERSL
jgi:hypothetical protein